jgi:hypothetical protein
VLRSAFGELALLYSAPRAATVRTTSTCQLWVASRGVVNTIKRHFAQKAKQVSISCGLCGLLAAPRARASPFDNLRDPTACCVVLNDPLLALDTYSHHHGLPTPPNILCPDVCLFLCSSLSYPQTRIDLLNQVAMFGCLTEEHKQLLASALEQVGPGEGDKGAAGQQRNGQV